MTNNDILFKCQYDLIAGRKNLGTYLEVNNYLLSYEIHKGNEEEAKENFSHDNMTGVICWLEAYAPSLKRYFPLFGHHSLRPDNFVFYLWCKYPLLGIWFLWIKSIAILISALRDKRIDRHGNEYRDTDGVILGSLAVVSTNMLITRKLLAVIIAYKWGSVREVFLHYHKNSDNPWQKKIYEFMFYEFRGIYENFTREQSKKNTEAK